MVLDILKNCRQYYALHRLFPAAFEHLINNDLSSVAPGKHEIKGEELFAIAAEGRGKSFEDAKLEAHRSYIDIQYLLGGDEEIGWSTTEECSSALSPFDEEKDIIFFEDKPKNYMKIQPGSFAIFFPEDAHAPMISEGIVKKVVLKIKL